MNFICFGLHETHIKSPNANKAHLETNLKQPCKNKIMGTKEQQPLPMLPLLHLHLHLS